MMKVYCKDCRYVDWIPVDGPVMHEPRCKKIKGHTRRDTPLESITTPKYCNPYSDNILNKCPYFEENQPIIDRIFTWGWI